MCTDLRTMLLKLNDICNPNKTVCFEFEYVKRLYFPIHYF